MRVLDLFSGIGGFSLGLEQAGMRTVAFCELDPYCRAVLKKHWPGVPCFEDIHAIDADRLDRLGRIDLICGGFPCQPFSVAGKQRASEDDRHLWPQMRRVIALARPTWVLAENVTGLIALALDEVLADLEGLGYACRSVVIPACAVDAHHRRDRAWIIARDRDRESACPVDAEAQVMRGTLADGDGERLEERVLQSRVPGEAESGRARKDACMGRNADDSNAIGSGCPRISRSWEEGATELCRWFPEPDVGRVAHGVPNRVHRLRALGNSVVPQVVEEIGRAIMIESA